MVFLLPILLCGVVSGSVRNDLLTNDLDNGSGGGIILASIVDVGFAGVLGDHETIIPLIF